MLSSGSERFTAEDLQSLSSLVAGSWSGAAHRDWSVPAGTLEWSCLATADHAVDCVYAPAFFLASRRQDSYPAAGADLTLGHEATPPLLVESLQIATRMLSAVVRDAEPGATAVMFQQPEPVIGRPPDFLPRAGLELILHAHDVATGLAVEFEPAQALCERLREHTRPWPLWTRMGAGLGRSADAWGDLLSASGRSRVSG